jgi:predicted dehydrogenase
MAPIRVVLVGLAPNADLKPNVGNWGVLAHMKPILASPKYELVGVCNSSAESSQRSIDFHKLPSTVRAFDVESLAAATDVDLVAVSVNVERHAQVAKPLLAAGKNVLVEWPLGSSTAEAEELTALAAKTGAKTVVGLQLRADPWLKKIRQILKDGTIGDVRSSVVEGCTSALPSDIWIDHATYYISMKTGGSEFTIYFGHCKLNNQSVCIID